MRLSRPLGLGVVCPGAVSFSSDERVPWVVVESARVEGSSVVGLPVAEEVLIGMPFGLDDQNVGIVLDGSN